MFVPLDRDSPTPLARQISSYLEGLIRHGHLEPGDRLPATRTLASALGVNKKTVESAYDELAHRKLVRALAGRGFSVRKKLAPSPELDLPFREPRGRDPLPASAWLGLAEATERPIDLAGEGARTANVSSRQLRLFHESALATSRGALFSPPPPLGETSLRAAGCRQLARCGVLRTPDEVAIRASRSEAVRDVLRLFVPRRGVVLAEVRLDPDLVLPITERRARLVMLPASGDDSALASAVRRHEPRLLIVATGTSRLPGVAPDPVRRRTLIDLARELGIPILEDVTGTDRLDRPPVPPPLAALDPTGRVFPLCDFSDEAGGGFVGAALGATSKALDRIRASDNPVDPVPDRLAQRALASALDSPHRVRAHRQVREKRTLRKAAMTRCLRRRLPALDGWEFTPEADAVRLDLPDDVAARDLARRARDQGVIVRTAAECGASKSGDRFLLLDLTRHDEGEILEGIRRLGVAFDELEESAAGDADQST